MSRCHLQVGEVVSTYREVEVRTHLSMHLCLQVEGQVLRPTSVEALRLVRLTSFRPESVQFLAGVNGRP